MPKLERGTFPSSYQVILFYPCFVFSLQVSEFGSQLICDSFDRCNCVGFVCKSDTARVIGEISCSIFRKFNFNVVVNED